MATHKPINWAKVAKVAGLVVAGVLALVAGAIPDWNWGPDRQQPPRNGNHEEDGEDQLHMAVVRIWAIRESAGDLCPCPAQRHRAIL